MLLHQVFTLENTLLLAALLFSIGAYGVLTRRNLLTVLMSLEIMLNAVNLVLVAFNSFQWSARPAFEIQARTGGQVFVMMIIAVAAAEAAVGLAILVTLFRKKQSVDTRDFQRLQG
ncbi:MAG: NADH-quinone oxidoreductase subunit NuoK [Planctomycetes bacterium]|nr:NADH-quinone oxidoreductase subunit NuoK [Planctomycetota bacterium]